MFCVARILYSIFFSYFSRGFYVSLEAKTKNISELINYFRQKRSERIILTKSLTSNTSIDDDVDFVGKNGKKSAFTRCATPHLPRELNKKCETLETIKDHAVFLRKSTPFFSIQRFQSKLYEHSIQTTMDEYSVYSKFSWSMFQDILSMGSEFSILLHIILRDQLFFQSLASDNKWLDEIRKLVKGVRTSRSRDILMRTSFACGKFLAWTRRIISEVLNLRRKVEVGATKAEVDCSR